MVGCFHGMLLLSTKCPRPPGRRENSVWKTMWRTIQRANIFSWSNGWMSPDLSTTSITTSSIWQESITLDLRWLWADRGRILTRMCAVCGLERFGKVGCIRNLSSKNQRERSIDHTKRKWIHIPCSKWYSKIVRERLRFPRTHSKRGTNRKERSFQWKTSKWIGESLNLQKQQMTLMHRADFWSIQGDFIYRHHNEPRVQLYVPKEETFPVPLKYIDLTRSTHTDVDVMQRETCRWQLECRFEQKLVSFVERFHEVYSFERISSQRIYVVRWEVDKCSNDFQTRSCMARSMDPNW